MLDILASYHCMQFQGKRWPKFGQQFFSKIWPRQSLDIMFSYHLVQYPEKQKIQSSENLVTGRTDGRMDRQIDQPNRQTDESDFILFLIPNNKKINDFISFLTSAMAFSALSRFA